REPISRRALASWRRAASLRRKGPVRQTSPRARRPRSMACRGLAPFAVDKEGHARRLGARAVGLRKIRRKTRRALAEAARGAVYKSRARAQRPHIVIGSSEGRS